LSNVRRISMRVPTYVLYLCGNLMAHIPHMHTYIHPIPHGSYASYAYLYTSYSYVHPIPIYLIYLYTLQCVRVCGGGRLIKININHGVHVCMCACVSARGDVCMCVRLSVCLSVCLSVLMSVSSINKSINSRRKRGAR
jgi:hypothetical protein